jgi:hypothetical protein
MYICEEERDTVVIESCRARRTPRNEEWKIAKRGTIFTCEDDLPTDSQVDWLKDVTHVFRVKTGGRNRGRREWGATFWISNRASQRFISPNKVRTNFKLFMRACAAETLLFLGGDIHP